MPPRSAVIFRPHRGQMQIQVSGCNLKRVNRIIWKGSTLSDVNPL
ncbi:Uncharacterized protein YR821_1068 [Yersinia ruckeri]|uniref:Uncharacterized protein n=1 Tax=Yersinia ruckeri TaxID=29486 RepID=A0A0A8VH10_YERRU|nr:Uncharacterized protein YR821_1068 [Yersinia ruckeri]CEK26896.1 hypothetical protein CSF007_5675 [Yersinia ruckeri]